MRVLMVTPHFPPSVGGVERHVLMLSKALVRLGCEVKVYTPVPGPPSVDGLSVARAPKRGKFGGWLRCLRRLDLFGWADVVHLHTPYALLSLSLPARLLLPRRPFVITLHGYPSLPPPRVDAFFQRLSARLCRATFCVGEFVAKWYGIGNCRIIWGATEAPPEPSPFPAEPVLAYVGRLDRDRPALEAVLAAVFARREGVGLKLLVAGDGPLRAKLEALARRVGVEAEFLGWLEEPREALRRSTMVMASGYLSALEAMSEGRPTLAIVRDRWEADYWRGFPGPVVLTKSAREAGKGVASLLSDRGRFVEMSRQSREFALRMTWEGLAEAHLEVYRRVAGRG